jgi:hypothetical protein
MGKGKIGKRKSWKIDRYMSAGMGAAKAGYSGVQKLSKILNSFKTSSAAKRHNRPQQKSSKRKVYSNPRQDEVAQHSDLSTRTVVIGKGKKVIRDKSQAKINYTHVWDKIETGIEGNQLVAVAHNLLTSEAFMAGTNQRASLEQIGYAIFDMNPNEKVTGSGAITAGTIPEEQIINVEKIVQEMTIWNTTTNPITVNVMYMMCTKDTVYSPKVYWGTCLANSKVGVANYVTQPTVSVGTYSPGAIYDVTSYGQYPTYFSGFKSMWKCAKAHKVTLQSGGQRKIKLVYYVNRKIHRSYVMEQQERAITYLKGLSVVPMIIARGTSCVVTDNDISEVTYSQAQVGIIVKEQYVFSVPRAPPSAPINLAGYAQVCGSHAERNINDVDVPAAVQKVV